MASKRKALSSRVNRPARAERIRHCMELMARGEWVRGETGKALAKKWGLSNKEMEIAAAEASRRIKEHWSDAEFLEECREKLWETVCDAQGDKQHSARVAAIKLLMESRGLLTQKHRVEVNQPRSEAEALAELLADPTWGPRIKAYVEGGVIDVPALPGKGEDE